MNSMSVARRTLVILSIVGNASAAALALGNCHNDGQDVDVRISELRPTQPSVGLGEVKKKAKDLADVNPDQGNADAGDPVPVVAGPDGKLYVIDHHHFVYALNSAHPNALVHVRIVDNEFCASCSPSNDTCTLEFWTHMTREHLAYLCDEKDRPIPFSALPQSFDAQASPALKNDPYRTLVAVMRKVPPSGSKDPCLLRPKADKLFWEFRVAEKIRRNMRKDREAEFEKAYAETMNIPQNIIDAACSAWSMDTSDESCAKAIAEHPNLILRRRDSAGS